MFFLHHFENTLRMQKGTSPPFYSNKVENGININYLFYIRNCKVFVIVAKSFHTTDFAGSCA